MKNQIFEILCVYSKFLKELILWGQDGSRCQNLFTNKLEEKKYFSFVLHNGGYF